MPPKIAPEASRTPQVGSKGPFKAGFFEASRMSNIWGSTASLEKAQAVPDRHLGGFLKTFGSSLEPGAIRKHPDFLNIQTLML